MTKDELKEKLESLDDAEFAAFRRDFGGEENRSRDDIVRVYVDFPKHERRMCQLLGLVTEEEKMTGAAVSSAGATVSSAAEFSASG